jgi:hypothetical protein
MAVAVAGQHSYRPARRGADHSDRNVYLAVSREIVGN